MFEGKTTILRRVLMGGMALLCFALLAAGVFFFNAYNRTLSGKLFASRAALLAAVNPGILLAQSNADRVRNGVSLLAENALLSRAAQAKADDMLNRGYYAHITPDGKSPLYFVDQTGYKYLNVGENLDLTYLSTEEDVETAWLNSPSHRENLLLPQFTEVGVGVSSGQYQGYDVTFAVEIYATPLREQPVVPLQKTLLKSAPKTLTALRTSSDASNFIKIVAPSLTTPSTPASLAIEDKSPGAYLRAKAVSSGIALLVAEASSSEPMLATSSPTFATTTAFAEIKTIALHSSPPLLKSDVHVSFIRAARTSFNAGLLALLTQLLVSLIH